MNLPFIKKRDIVIISILIIIVISGLLFIKFSGQGNVAEIYVDGKLYKSVNLSNESTINLDYMVIEVKNNSIGVVETDCPDKICENTGFISSPSQTIVCVPNKVVINIKGNKKADISVG